MPEVTTAAGDVRPLVEPEGLVRTLAELNALRAAGGSGAGDPVHRALEQVFDRAFGTSRRLAVYGSLQPGEVHAGVLGGLAGRWLDGHVHGDWSATGWGATMGFPAIRWRPDGARVPVNLFISDALPHHWERLDRFEGGEYLRILVPVYDARGLLAVANLYEARTPPDA